MKRTATFFRHAQNQRNALTSEGVDATLAKAVEDGVYSDFFHGFEARTMKTLALLTIKCSRGRFHRPIGAIGDGKLFAEMFTEKVRELITAEDIFTALQKTHGEERVKEWAKLALSGLELVFQKMEGDHALVVGHMPMIPLIVVALGHPFFSLKNLESVAFEMSEEGEIVLLSSPA